jgi:hypothetical protein
MIIFVEVSDNHPPWKWFIRKWIWYLVCKWSISISYKYTNSITLIIRDNYVQYFVVIQIPNRRRWFACVICYLRLKIPISIAYKYPYTISVTIGNDYIELFVFIEIVNNDWNCCIITCLKWSFFFKCSISIS